MARTKGGKLGVGGQLLSSWTENSPPYAERCGGHPLPALAQRAGIEIRAVIGFAVGAGQPVTRALVPGRLIFAACLRLKVHPCLHHIHFVDLRSKLGPLGSPTAGAGQLCDDTSRGPRSTRMTLPPAQVNQVNSLFCRVRLPGWLTVPGFVVDCV